MNESALRCHHPEKERTPSDSLTGLGVRDASNDRDSLILQHADNRIGDVHDVEIMRLRQFAPAAAAQVQIPDLFAQHDAFNLRILQRNMQRPRRRCFDDRTGNDHAAPVEVIVADHDDRIVLPVRLSNRTRCAHQILY